MALLEDVGIGAINNDDPQKQIESVVKQTNEALRQLSNEDRTKIIKDDSGTQRLLTGFQQDGFDNGNVGVKLSQQGYDVTSATADQLIFSTDFNSFKIVQSGTGTVSYAGSSGQATATVAHNLGYVPAAMVYYDDGTQIFGTPWSLATSAGLVSQIIDWYVTSTDLVLRFTKLNVAGGTYSSDATIDYRYYLLQETAN